MAGDTINAAVWQANAVLNHHRCLKPMIDAGKAAQTRPDDINFFTVDTIIQKAGKAVTITQYFVLPQCQLNVTRPNMTVHVILGYVRENPTCLCPPLYLR